MKYSGVFGLLIIAIIAALFLTAGDGINSSPSARAYHQMAYDTESGLVILYGGQTGDWLDQEKWNRETWTFDTNTNDWSQKFPNVDPDASLGGSMTYNSKADRIILSAIPYDRSALQTWAYDVNFNTWARLADGPQVMLGHRIAYDSESDRVILFGGFDMTSYKLVNETWAYDYNTDTWTNMHPSRQPHKRNYHGMTYDPKADRIVVWGGDIQGPDGKEVVWTYDYNTNTWQDYRYENGPANRDYIDLVYDDKADKFIMYGGYSYGNDETWVYDLSANTWQLMQPEINPGIISRYAMVYAKNSNNTILFGGQDGATNYQFNNETWSYKLNADKWINISSDH